MVKKAAGISCAVILLTVFIFILFLWAIGSMANSCGGCKKSGRHKKNKRERFRKEELTPGSCNDPILLFNNQNALGDENAGISNIKNDYRLMIENKTCKETDCHILDNSKKEVDLCYKGPDNTPNDSTTGAYVPEGCVLEINEHCGFGGKDAFLCPGYYPRIQEVMGPNDQKWPTRKGTYTGISGAKLHNRSDKSDKCMEINDSVVVL